MKKILIVLLVFSTINNTLGQINDTHVDNLRELTVLAFEDGDMIDSLKAYLNLIYSEENGCNSPLALAYKGVAESISAQDEFWPWDKLSTLNDGLDIISRAIEIDSTIIEIRLLKFYILDNVPGIIGYSDDAESELNRIHILVNSFKADLDPWVSKRVINVLLDGNRINEQEANSLRERFSLVKKNE